MKRTLLGLAIGGLMMFSSAQAVVNAGFETGDLTGWNTALSGGSANVVTSANINYGDTGNYVPVAGNYFLTIVSGSANVWQTVSQTFTLGAGQSLSGSAAFDWGDYSPFLDGARVRVLDAVGAELATVFSVDGGGHADGYSSPWTNWSWTASSAGTYQLEYAARNTIDGSGVSYGYFDAAEVPEPTSIALIGIALLGLGISRSKKA